MIAKLRKMKAELGEPVQYYLRHEDELINVNQLIGKTINWNYNGTINCIVCGRKTPKSFAQGMCYPCFRDSPENSECIIKPELCRGHLGEGRDVEWELQNHVQPHAVYLAVSSDIKVGVTRNSQIPTRWIDQGASRAIVLAETPNRYLAGMIEVSLRQHLSDKTNWQKMLKNETANLDLHQKKEEIKDLLEDEFVQYVSNNNEITEIQYPVEEYPHKVSSINLDKTPSFELKLKGIKGQYLIFEGGNVLNVRNFAGYNVEIQVT